MSLSEHELRARVRPCQHPLLRVALMGMMVLSLSCGPATSTNLRPQDVISDDSYRGGCSLESLTGTESSSKNIQLQSSETSCGVVAHPVATLIGRLTLDEQAARGSAYSGFVAQDSRGRLVTAARWLMGRNSILVWDSTGNLLSEIGEREWAVKGTIAGTLTPFIGFDDSLYVVGHDMITVFDSGYNEVRANDTRALSQLPWLGTRMTSSGTFSSVGCASQLRNGNRICVASSSGTVVRLFGMATPFTEAIDNRNPLLAAGTGESFWVVAETTEGSMYSLEEWNTTGRLLRRMERTVSGFDSMPIQSAESVRLYRLHIDLRGYLWLLYFTRPSKKPNSIQVHFDVVNPASGIVLSTGSFEPMRVDAGFESWPPFYDFIPNTNRCFRPTRSAEKNVRSLAIFELELKDRFQ